MSTRHQLLEFGALLHREMPGATPFTIAESALRAIRLSTEAQHLAVRMCNDREPRKGEWKRKMASVERRAVAIAKAFNARADVSWEPCGSCFDMVFGGRGPCAISVCVPVSRRA